MTALPKTMNALVADRPGGPDALALTARPVPEPGPGEILVRVRAAGLNRADAMQRAGNYPPPPGVTDILGLEFAGEVAARGDNATRFAPGEAVAALVSGGGCAEYCVVHETNALPLPEGYSMVEAAALPEACFTVWSNLFERGGLADGETALIHGGSSGIGTTAIQLAKAFGARVITTAGSDARCAACVRLGADVAINHRTTDFVAAVKEATDGHGADVILDIVGGDYVQRNYAAAAEDGRIVQVAVQKGARAEANFRVLMAKRLTHTGSTLRPRPVDFKAGLAAALHEHVWPLLETRKVAPVIDSTFAFAAAAEGHARLESGAHFGKIVLTVE